MPDGGLLDIKTSLTFQDGTNYAVVEISDTGKGIPQRRLSKLGELPASTQKREGRGFGLFLSREIIKSYGGKLFWESIKDKGTVFKVFFPVR